MPTGMGRSVMIGATPTAQSANPPAVLTPGHNLSPVCYTNPMPKSINPVGSSIYKRIKDDIIFGHLAADSKLKLNVLKESYDASVTTLRETLTRLGSEGFVKAEDQRGFFVAPLSRKYLKEITELRILIECAALSQSIENGTTEWEGNVIAAHHQLKKIEATLLSENQVELMTWKKVDFAFHQTLLSACDSSLLLDMHALVYDKFLRYQIQVLAFKGQVAINEHQSLLEAVMNRHNDQAQSLLKAHIHSSLDHVKASAFTQ